MLPSTNSPAPPDTNPAPATLPPNPTPDPALIWTARADWVDAEDGTVVALRPGALAPRNPMPDSEALWPARRSIIAASPRLLAALEGLVALTIEPGDDAAQDAAWSEARSAIAQAQGVW